MGSQKIRCLRLVQTDCVKQSKIENYLTGHILRVHSIDLPYCILRCELCTSERAFSSNPPKSNLQMSGNELSQILFLFAMPLMVKVKRRPVWTSVGLVVSGIGCLLMAVPYWAHTSTDPVTNFEAAKSRSAINGFNLIKSFDCNH